MTSTSSRLVTRFVIGLAVGLAVVAGCAPRVAIEAPKEPITINMNIKIEHEIRVKVDRDLDEVFADKEDIF